MATAEGDEGLFCSGGGGAFGRPAEYMGELTSFFHNEYILHPLLAEKSYCLCSLVSFVESLLTARTLDETAC